MSVTALPQCDVIEDWELYAKDVPVKGRGVFPRKAIPPNKLVLRFEGPIFTRDTCPDFSEAIQVGVNAWMWSSGGLDDLVNHSCNPNCGLYSLNGRIHLVSLREIQAEEELSFDYSTSMVDEPWSMECACGEALCRRKVGNFIEMSAERQRFYADRGIIPEHTRLAYLTRGAGADPVRPDSPAVDHDDSDEKPLSNKVENWDLYVKNVDVKGRGVFVGRDIPRNKLVLKFEGPVYTRETCPDFSEAIQVGLNAWMWSSGGLDDLVNHSCNPNCGLYSLDGNLYLLSLRDIDEGEELSFDYSTSMVDEPWGMECACGEPNCRRSITNFLDLPLEDQLRYAEAGVLPEHVLAAYVTRGFGRDLPPKSMKVRSESAEAQVPTPAA